MNQQKDDKKKEKIFRNCAVWREVIKNSQYLCREHYKLLTPKLKYELDDSFKEFSRVWRSKNASSTELLPLIEALQKTQKKVKQHVLSCIQIGEQNETL
jgi:hypothetical protein